MLVTGGRGRKIYSREDVAVAAVPKSMSRKAYKFLRKKSTLGEWPINFSLDTNGLQHSFLDIVTAKNLSEAGNLPGSDSLNPLRTTLFSVPQGRGGGLHPYFESSENW